jgi:hypothetical protein
MKFQIGYYDYQVGTYDFQYSFGFTFAQFLECDAFIIDFGKWYFEFRFNLNKLDKTLKRIEEEEKNA